MSFTSLISSASSAAPLGGEAIGAARAVEAMAATAAWRPQGGCGVVGFDGLGACARHVACIVHARLLLLRLLDLRAFPAAQNPGVEIPAVVGRTQL
jgi:hypothetical protein